MKAFTDKEIITLITTYRRKGIKACRVNPDRSDKSLYEKVRRLKLQRIPRWSESDLNTLMNSNNITDASHILKRTENACRIKKHRINNYGK
jgi:hypothetical protein